MSKENLIPTLRFPEFKNEREWDSKEFSKFIKLDRGSSPRPIQDYLTQDESGVNWIKIGDTKNAVNSVLYQVEEKITLKGAEKSRRVEKGELILANSMSFGKTYQLAIEGCIYDGWFVLRKYESHFNKPFLLQLLNSDFMQNQYKRLSAGGIVQNISSDIVYNSKLFHTTLPEQQKIASCLSSLDEVIAAHSQKLELLKDHKKGLMQNLFPQDGETVPKVRFPEFEGDGEWVEDSLVNIAKFRRGSFPQPYGLPEWYDDEDGMPFIQVYDVDDNFRLKPSTKRKISKLAAEQSVFIEKGTVIITIQGSIGRVAITQFDAYIDRTLLIFQEFYNVIDRAFFAYTLFLLFEIEKQKAPGGIIKTITKQVLSDFTIKIPSLEEQQKIASCLSAVDELITAQQEKIEQLQQHKKGLMQGLFPKIER